jgi:hypothetical protein
MPGVNQGRYTPEEISKPKRLFLAKPLRETKKRSTRAPKVDVTVKEEKAFAGQQATV